MQLKLFPDYLMKKFISFGIYSLSLLLFICHASSAQDTEFMENLLNSVEEETGSDNDWLEYLWELKENPLNLNRAGLQELTRIPFLTPQLAMKIISYRNKKGDFKSVNDLYLIEGFSEEIVDALRLFVQIEKRASSPIFVYRIRGKYNFPEKEGYKNNTYEKPLYLQQRLIFQAYRNISGSVLIEKDAGEKDAIDYLSIALKYKPAKKDYQILIGDFQSRIGSGLVIGPAYGMPLSAWSVPTYSGNLLDSRENRSFGESGFLRGIAFQNSNFLQSTFLVFHSNHHIDGNLSDDGKYLRSLYLSGLHRTSNEQEKRRSVGEKIWGISWVKRFSDQNIQISKLKFKYHPVFLDQKAHLDYLSVSYAGRWGKIHPRVEFALFQNGYPGFQQFLSIIRKDFDYEIGFYYYHPRYFAPRGRAFGKISTSPNNRTGFIQLLNYRFLPQTILAAYIYFSRPVLQKNEEPFLKKDLAVEIIHKINHHRVKLRFRQKHRSNNLQDSQKPEKLIRSARTDYEVKISRNFSLRNRLELRWGDPLEKNHRYYSLNFYHQVNYKFSQKYKIVMRWSAFDIPDYDLRIYEYETDLPGSFRTVMLNDRGYKWFFLIRVQPLKKMQLDLKFQQRFYPDLETLGSGADELKNNRVNEIGLSLILRY